MSKKTVSKKTSLQIHSLSDLRQQVQDFILNFLHNKTIVLLKGDLGVGKTQWVSLLVAELMKDNTQKNNTQKVCSPSFSIHNRYEIKDDFAVDHIDLYRLKDDEDLETTGFWDLFASPKGVILIEWGDRLQKDFLPLDWAIYELELQKAIDSETRTLTLLRL